MNTELMKLTKLLTDLVRGSGMEIKSRDEILQEERVKDSKKILKDWVRDIRESAEKVRKYIKDSEKSCFNKEEFLNIALEYTNDILGQCKTMETVLKNSD